MASGTEETERQIRELTGLRDVHRQRLAVLQIQAARFGNDAPAHILTEIADLDTKLTDIGAKLLELEKAQKQAALDAIEIPDSQSLVPVSIVPQTINERLIAIMGAVENWRDETRRNFTAVQLAIRHEAETRQASHEQTREIIVMEKDSREVWQAEDGLRRASREQFVNRLFIAIMVTLALVVVALVALGILIAVVISNLGG